MQKNYYAIIPASIRYDSELTPNAKLMYGELTALSNEKGYCWASNSYFSQLYNVSNVSISKWISQLQKKKYIDIEYIYYKNSKQISERRISLIPLKEKLTHKEKLIDPIKEKFKDNTILYNNTKNNNIVQNQKNDKSVKNSPKKDIVYSSTLIDANEHIIELFPERFHPKSTAQINKWLDTLEKLQRLDGYSLRLIYYIVKKVRNDQFWSNNFYSIMKLRSTNKDGIKYIDLFKEKFARNIEIQ